ncbi:hypothetical protein GGS26DRAFT_598869 [Hypomontagnella submonticulosa]|nr:hypothetical protein GGS26DRAFT_598869 [Hypomontagnella submonticulosa]
MLALALLLFPFSALAGPLTGGLSQAPSVKRDAEPAFFAPAPAGSEPYRFCEEASYKLSKSRAGLRWSEWQAIRDWAQANNGQWDLTRTTTNHYGDWNILYRSNDTYIAVQSSEITAIGSQDVVDLIDRIHKDLQPNQYGYPDWYSFEEKGSFGNCIGNVHVTFYLRMEFHFHNGD